MKTVYIVHVIDTEGPLAEKTLFEEYSHQNSPAFVPNDFSNLKDVIGRHRKNVLGSWEQIFKMLRDVTSEKNRNSLLDSFGGGWKFNWFCMDHVGFKENPRRRLMGYHEIHDFYSELVNSQKMGDVLHWHYHPMSTYREANKCSTDFLTSELHEGLCRKLIDRNFFPSAYRAGFQDVRPDSHWFREQWIPFDLTNTASQDLLEEDNPDLVHGRFSDWRWAPDDWSTYYPHPRNHQIPGDCRSKIGRCLNILNRFANLDETEIEKAFQRAQSGRSTLLSFAGHDWRDLNVEIAYFKKILVQVARKFPDVKFKYADVVEAFNAVHPEPSAPPLELECSVVFNDLGYPEKVRVIQKKGKIFGSQPFFAVQTRSKKYLFQNMNYGATPEEFHFVFDDQSILPDDVRAIGVASNDAQGFQSKHVIRLDEDRSHQKKILF
ncbi:MAG TPA: hypothetical protein VJN02_12070 [Gammaproteobacteria bacterium]|nr:MAG: hypothetical protein A3E83_06670 [Gammaproteobacteria bacterium RIFCSPHIGHO2_12_FULL_41_20]HLB43558.1 hypothetical protein [Gammaproteobacteria bacterium]